MVLDLGTRARAYLSYYLNPHWHEFLEIALSSHEISLVVDLATFAYLISKLNYYEKIAKRCVICLAS